MALHRLEDPFDWWLATVQLGTTVAHPGLRDPSGDQSWSAIWLLFWEQELDGPAAARCARNCQCQKKADTLHASDDQRHLGMGARTLSAGVALVVKF